MRPDEKLRAGIDRLRKTYAKVPLLATGGDKRMSGEAVNTAAMARLQGKQREVPRNFSTIALRELVKRKG